MERIIMEHIEFVKGRIEAAKQKKQHATDLYEEGIQTGMVIAYEMELNDLEYMLVCYHKHQEARKFVYEGAIK
ncbi:hypothetical protein P8864_10605 [Priestia flexa]|uniref:hypothetical protein n=1 Tax=Priestia flexa TaxID=86664 RepID=UPI000C2365C7|nr:hypothetical protein [Priestia flexa]MEC0666340.1 hypothetical protein [Priestia flexa]